MDKSNPVRSSGGIGMGWVFFTLFLVLKLAGVIHWSWWWVAAPLWAPVAVAGLFILLYAVIVGGADS